MSEEEEELLLLEAEIEKHRVWLVRSIAFMIVFFLLSVITFMLRELYYEDRLYYYDVLYGYDGDLSYDELVVLDDRYQFLSRLSISLALVGLVGACYMMIASGFTIDKITAVKKIKRYRDEARRDEKVFNFGSAIKIYEELGEKGEVERVKKLLAHRREKARDYDAAINIYEELGEIEEAARVRKLKARQGSVRVAQKVVHGDEITTTTIKDSVVSKSNIGSGGDDKLTKIKELKELHDSGAIDDDEFQQMKKEILGK